MGNDEHGPAYPEHVPENVKPFHEHIARANAPAPYRCPICNGDKNRFFTCEYPGCFDGRDRGHPYARQVETYDLEPSRPSTARSLIGWACALTLLLYIFWPHVAPAMDHGFDPFAPTTKWMESLEQPANRPGSCCGKADSYQADIYRRHKNGSYTVTITDGSPIKFPDGQYRTPLQNGTVLEVPADHVNSPSEQAGNPTGHAWIFMSVYGTEEQSSPGSIYCFVPLPEGY